MAATLFRIALQSIIYLGSFSRFTHGRYTPDFYQYQLERAPNNQYTLIIPICDLLFGTLLFFRRLRLWVALLCAVAQGGGIVKLVQEGKDVTPDIGLFTLAVLVFLTSWRR